MSSSPTPARAEDLAWPRVPDHAMLVVPVGSTEQHGPHLPLGTDTWIARAVTDAAVADPRVAHLPIVVGPPVAYGASGEHQHFPGTLSIGHDALRLLLVELGRSAAHWAQRLLLVNGHGGNVRTVRDAVVQLRAEGRDVAWVPCAWPGADPHAGAFETSLLLAFAPRAVDVRAAEPGPDTPLADLLPRLQAEGVRGVSPNGVLGDPSTASAAAGREALAGMAEDVAARLLRWVPAPDGRLTA